MAMARRLAAMSILLCHGAGAAVNCPRLHTGWGSRRTHLNTNHAPDISIRDAVNVKRPLNDSNLYA